MNISRFSWKPFEPSSPTRTESLARGVTLVCGRFPTSSHQFATTVRDLLFPSEQAHLEDRDSPIESIETKVDSLCGQWFPSVYAEPRIVPSGGAPDEARRIRNAISQPTSREFNVVYTPTFSDSRHLTELISRLISVDFARWDEQYSVSNHCEICETETKHTDHENYFEHIQRLEKRRAQLVLLRDQQREKSKSEQINVQRRIDDLEDHCRRIRERIESLTVELSLNLHTSRVERLVDESPKQPGDPRALGKLRADVLHLDTRITRWQKVNYQLENERRRLRASLTRGRLEGFSSTIDTLQPFEENLQQFSRSANRVQAACEHFSGTNKKFSATDSAIEQLNQDVHHIYRNLRSIYSDLVNRQTYVNREHVSLQLKRIRRTRRGVGKHLVGLLRRRERLFDQYGQKYPLDLDLLRLAQRVPCRWANENGYCSTDALWDRDKLVPADYTFSGYRAETVQKRDPAEVAMLDHKREELDRLHAELRDMDIRRRDLKNRLVEFEPISASELDAYIETIDEDLWKLSSHRDRDDLPHQPCTHDVKTRSSEIMTRASGYLQRILSNQYSNLFFRAESSELRISDELGQTTPLIHATKQEQTVACLALILAIADHRRGEGNVFPLILDDLFAHLPTGLMPGTLEVLREFSLCDHQVILTTEDATICRQCQRLDIAVVELPDYDIIEPTVPSPGERLVYEGAKPVEPLGGKTIVRRTNNSDAEEFPGEFSDQSVIQGELPSFARESVQIRTPEAYDLDHASTVVIRLMTEMPDLTSFDALVLASCDITCRAEYQRVPRREIWERIRKLMATDRGQRLLDTGTDDDLARLTTWLQSHASVDRHAASDDSVSNVSVSASTQPQADGGDDRNQDTIRFESAGTYEKATPFERASESKSKQSSKPKRSLKSDLRFYLSTSDAVEAAPEIGPKTAEKLEEIGIMSVGDLLACDPEAVADEIDMRRVNVETVERWQTQSKLVCLIPNLRGHDAQLLVACGFTEPEEIAGMNPAELLDIIGPFSETKEGVKIIRAGKKPDLDEVSDWINWASQPREMRAA